MSAIDQSSGLTEIVTLANTNIEDNNSKTMIVREFAVVLGTDSIVSLASAERRSVTDERVDLIIRLNNSFIALLGVDPFNTGETDFLQYRLTMKSFSSSSDFDLDNLDNYLQVRTR